MDAVREEARAKINLALHVLGRRADGYHELSSVVAFADCSDGLALTPAAQNTLAVTGPFAGHVPPGEDNLIFKAWRHLASLFSLPKVSVQLEKNIPVAAGIGGGSADAAAMVRACLRLAGQRLDDAQRRALAVALGADVPVCLSGRACRMTGIGELLHDLEHPLPVALVLANPRVAVGTVDVFREMGLQPGQAHDGGSNLWRNDMTQAAIRVQPIIADVLTALEASELGTPRMSGSGATCFVEAKSFDLAQQTAARLAANYPNWWIKAARLS
jgi:4-diphosphocytidyl-2-C-methyl-D-erythritol kinase